MKYLGYVINGLGISPGISRIKALKGAPIPDSTEKLRSFLGFAQYYAQFRQASVTSLHCTIPEFGNATSLTEDYNRSSMPFSMVKP